MSKKAVRVRKSAVKQWMAIILGSLSASAMQAAQAAPEHDRTTFREFRDQNPGIDRQTLRGMYRQEFGGAGGARNAASPSTFLAVPSLSGNVNTTQSTGASLGSNRADRWTQRLERHNGVVNQSLQNNSDGNLVSLKNGVNLDLSSTVRNITLGQKLFGNVNSVEISVGGEVKTISAGQQVTASEYVAVKQVLAGGGQKVTLDATGASIGGQVDLGSITANNDVMKASDLIVPVGVTTYGDFGKGSDFRLQGDLTNYGSVYAVSSSKSVRGGTIYADDITNQAGGVISTVLNNGQRNDLGGKGGAVDLGLNAKGDLSNYGSITSSGSLTLTAGGNLTNASDVSAVRDVNLSSSSIVNSGRVESYKGNVNVDGPATLDLNVNNDGGTISALNGAINVRNAAFSEPFNTNVSGGDLFSRELNLNAGDGVLRVDVNELTGTINQTGSEAHVQAATAELNIGQVCLTGDPTFKNSAGNINIAGDITVAEDLAIIASGNITSANNVTITATSAGQGYNITLIAGAEQLPGGTNSSTLPGGTFSGTTLTGNASTGGGSVLLGSGVTISSAGLNASDNAGDVLVAAFAGLNFNSGRVNLGGTQINANSGTGDAGDITIIAGAQNTTAVTLGGINAASPNLTNSVTVSTLQPMSSNGLNIVFNANGQITSGNTLVGNSGTPTTGGNIQINSGVIDVAGALGISSTGNINQAGGSTVSAAAAIILAEGNITNTASSTIGAGAFLVLTSMNGNIGSSASGRLNLTGPDIGAVASNGSVFINVTGAANIDGSAAGIFDLQANGAITTDNPITADVVNLRSLTSNVTLSQLITATTSATIRAQTGITSVIPASVTAPQVNLRSETGDIVGNVEATNLTVNALSGNATIVDATNLAMGGGSSFVSGALQVNAANLSTTSSVSGNQLSFIASGSLNIASNLTASNFISLTSAGNILNSSITGVLTSPNLQLTSTAGDIGTSATPLLLDANHVTLQANNVYFSDPNTVTVGTSTALFDFNVTANNNILSDGAISATDVVLQATNGSLGLNGLVTGTDSISLTSFNSISAGSIAGGLAGSGATVFDLTLASVNGSIGSLGQPLAVNATFVDASAAGSVTLTNSATSTSFIQGVAGLDFSYSTTGGSLTADGSGVSAGRNIILDSANSLSINDVPLSTTGGNISLLAGNSLFLNQDVSASGNVTAQTSSGSVFAGQIDAGGNVVIASGSNTFDSVFLNGDVTAAGNINISSNDSIFANELLTATTGDIVLDSVDSIYTNKVLSAGRDVRITSTTGNLFINEDVTAGRDVSLSGSLSVFTYQPISSRNVAIESSIGSVFVNGQVTATDTISLTSFDNISDANLGSPTVLSAPQINLTSTNGSIGSNANELDIDAVNLTLNAPTGMVYVVDPNSVNLTGINSAGTNLLQTFSVLGTTGLTLTAEITADVVRLSSSASIQFGGSITSRVARFSATGDVMVDSGSLVTATGQVQLSASNVGSVSGRLKLSSPSVVSLVTGSDYLDAVGNTTVSIAEGGLLDIRAEGDVNLGAIDVASLVGTSTGGGITATGTVLASSSVVLTAYDSFTAASNLNTVVTPTLSVTSTNGNVGDIAPILVSGTVSSLTLNAPSGFVNVQANNPNVALVGDSAAMGMFSLQSSGNITVPGTVSGEPAILVAAGTVSITGSVSSSDFVEISASSISATDIPVGTILAPAVVLDSATGIGSSLAPIQLATSELTFSAAAGSAYIENNGALNVLTGSASGTASVESTGDLSSSGTISGADVNLTSTSGILDLDGSVEGSNSITLTSFGSILNVNISGGLSDGLGGPVPNLTLVSTSGSIGSIPSSPLEIDATNLVALAANDVFITDTAGDVNVSGPSSAGAAYIFDLTATNNLTVGALGTISAKDVHLTALGGSLTLNALVTGTSNINLTANGAIDDSSILGGLSSPVINLTSDTSSINVTTVDFSTVTANAATFVNLTDTAGSMNIGPAPSSAGTTFTATSGSLSNDGTIDAIDVNLNATTGGFTFNNVISGTTSITLTSNDDILNGVGAGQLVTPTLIATSTTGNIGAALDPLTLSVSSVTLNAPLGSVWVENSQALGVGGTSGAAGAFSLTAQGTITVAAPISASDVTLKAKDGSGGHIAVNAAIAGTSQVTIASDAGIVSADLASTITTPVLNLITTTGSIGTLATPISITAGTVSVHAADSAFVTKPVGSLIVNESSAMNTLQISSNVNLTTAGELIGTDVALFANTGSLQINDDIIGVNSISLTSANSILNSNVIGELMSGLGVPVSQLNLNVTAGDIGTSLDYFSFDAVNIRANATGSVFLSDESGSVNFGGGASSAGNTFVAVSTGDISSSSTIGGQDVTLIADGAFDLDGAVTAVASISLNSGTGIANSNISGGLNAVALNLVALTGDIGAELSPLSIDTNVLKANAFSGSVYVDDSNSLTLRSDSSATGTLSVAAATTLLVQDNGVNLTAPIVILDAGNSLSIARTIDASTGTSLVSGGTLVQTAGSINTGDLAVSFVTGPVTLTTDAAKLATLGGSGQILTINEADGIELLAQAVGTLNINASQVSGGSVTTGGDFTVATLNIINNNGSILIGHDITATTAMTLNTQGGGSGSIQQTNGLLLTPSLTVLAGIGGIGTGGNELVFSNGANPVSLTANAIGGGDISVIYSGTGTVNVQASAGNDFVSIDTNNGGSIALAGNIAGSGTLSLTTDNLTSGFVASFDQITINNSPTGTLSISGGTYTTANGFSATSSHGISLSGAILLNGAGDAVFSVGDEPDQFIVNAGATVTGTNKLTVNACDLVFNGTITGNPLVIVCSNNGTIANSTGDVLLPSDLVFVGQNLAILAAGNITTTGSTLINLSGASGSGSLTLMAGYDFTPATGGQIQGPGLYTITGVSANGGSIDLTNVDIVLSGGTGSGGNLVAVANAGSLNDGSVILGTIDTTGTINGGNVTVTAPGGITIDSVTTTGGTNSGNVALSVANPTIVAGPVTVQNGLVLTGSFGVGTATSGDLTVNSLIAGAGDVTLLGAFGALDNIDVQNVNANRLNVNIGDGAATISNSGLNELNTNGSGTISLLNQTGAIVLNNIVGALQDLDVNASGTISTTSNAINIDNLNLQTSAGGDIQLNGNVSGATFITFDADGTITQTSGVVGGGQFSITFNNGPVTLNTSVSTLLSNAGTGSTDLTINETDDLILDAQGVNVLTVNVANGAVTTSSNFTVDDLTVNVANGTFAVSNSIGATGTTTVFADDGVTSSATGVINGDLVALDTNAALGVDASDKLQINANTFQVSGQNVFVNNNNVAASTLNASSAVGTLDVSTVGDLVSGGDYSAAVVALSTGGAFDLTSTINGTTSVSLTTDGDLTNITGTLNTPTLLLNSISGNVGTDANNPFLVAANVTSIGGTAGAGFFVTSAATGGVNFVAITAGDDISLKANGGLNLTQNITSTGGALAVQATQDVLDIADGITLLAHDQIDITQVGTVKKRDKIVFGAGSSVLTNAKIVGLGNINIVLGAPQSPGNKIPTPKKNVTIVENGGSVLFGGKKAQAAAPGNVFTAQGADVYVSTFNPKSIVFEGNVTITADPPVAEGTPVLIRQFAGVGGDSQPGALGTATISNELGSISSLNTALNLLPANSTSLSGLGVSILQGVQNISMNNATITSGASGVLTSGDLNTAGVSQVDDSYMTTSSPQATKVNASICSDIEFVGDVGFNGVEKMKHSAVVSVNSGSVLFAPTSDTTVVTPKGKVKVAANAVAMVVVEDTHLSVYDVNDLHKNSVVIEAAGRSIPLSPGSHAVITHAGVEQFSDINPVESIMHRGLSRHELGNGHRAFTSEFSVPAAIQCIKPLSAMILSNHSQAKKVKERVLKTSAIIMQLSSSTPYEYHAKPKTVALKW
ncbi:S-layer family protein [Candidatus Obscuribacterales bacterium]|nr:S-layer family protein [Candidatus Obscuribacterales bacterium]